MDFDIQLHDSGLQSALHICHGLVVHDRRDLFQEKSKQGTSAQIADCLITVFVEIALDGGDGCGAGFPGYFYAPRCSVPCAVSEVLLATGSNWRLISSINPLAASSIISRTSSKRPPSVR